MTCFLTCHCCLLPILLQDLSWSLTLIPDLPCHPYHLTYLLLPSCPCLNCGVHLLLASRLLLLHHCC